MPSIARAAVLLHPRKPISHEIADTVCAVLESAELSVVRRSVWDNEQLREVLPEVDVAITLGGDGSILRASRIAALFNRPVLGINLGKLGFLAEVEPRDVPERLPRIVRGEYWLETRIMLEIEHWRQSKRLAVHHALNEAVVGRRSLSRIVRVTAEFDGTMLTTYTADGVLVATPTGSTAYSHAAGGPILHPEVHSLVLTPICAHPNPSGSLVVPSSTVIALTVATDHEAALSIDGQEDVVVLDGDRVVIQISPYVARFVRSQERDYFYHTLLQKLRL